MFTLSTRHHDILAQALSLFAAQAHERALALHRSKFQQTAEAEEDLCCDTLELQAAFQIVRESHSDTHTRALLDRRAAALQLLIELNTELAKLGVLCPNCHTALADVAGGGVSAKVCPRCDEARLRELESEL